MKDAFAYHDIARQVLDGNWGLAVGSTLVAAVLGGTLSIGAAGGGGHGGSSDSGVYSGLYHSGPVGRIFLTLAALVAAILAIYLVIRLIIGGATTLGLARFNLNLYRRTQPAFSDIFSYFVYFGSAFVMNLLRTIYIFLWTLCLVIPGIMASYSYVMAPFIMAENPEMDANDVLGASKQMMYGHRFEYFCMELSFIGWQILCLCTAGIGFIFLMPYMNAARTAFYHDLLALHQQPYGAQM